MQIIPVEPKLTEYMHVMASRQKIPLSGTFELTPCCNMACRMCYVRKTREEQEAMGPLRPAEDWLELGRQVRDRGMLYLLLTGGEPFLRKDIRQIIVGLHRMGLLISINTNGTLIDEETVAWLKECPPVRFNITLYGASDETYARLCGNPHGFTQTTRAIRLLRDAGMLVKLNCSITPYNKDDLDAILDYANREGLVVQVSSYMFPPLRRDRSFVGTNDRFTPEEASYYAARIAAGLNGEDAFLQRLEEGKLFILPGDDLEDCLDTEGEMIRCRAGKCCFWVTWQGDLSPCGMWIGEQPKNVFREGFDAAWEDVVQTSCQIRLAPECRNCSLKEECRACAAMAFTETGSFHRVPEYRCRMAKSYGDACLKVAEEIRAKRRDREEGESHD